jgi:hypothetical protein
VKCIGTMRNTETPVQVEGVHLTERLVCKHVALYHPASWPRWKQELCANENKDGGGNLERLRASMLTYIYLIDTIDTINKRYESILKRICTLAETLKQQVAKTREWESIDFRQLDEKERTDIRIQIDNVEKDFNTSVDGIKKLGDDTNSKLVASKHLVACDKSVEEAISKSSTMVSRIIDVTEFNRDVIKGAMDDLYDLYLLCDKLNGGPSAAKAILDTLVYNVRVAVRRYSNEEEDERDVILEQVLQHSMAHRKIQGLDTASYKTTINNIASCLKPKQEEKESKESEYEANPESAEIQVPHDADMCVAVQVSGELFRIVHLTRDVDTQREKKAKREEEEKAKGEEAKRAKKTKKEEKAEKAEQEEIKKYDDAGYAKKMKEDKDGNYKGDKDAEVERLTADYDDYRECVSAARKYLEETCIVNDTAESWSSAAWRLTKECREEASGTSGSSGTSGTANFGHLEASDRLELVLVPRNLFGHVYGKGDKPTYDGKAEISKDGIWIYEANGRGKVCPKCAVCDDSNNHKEKKNMSGLFVQYNKSDKDRIRGLSSRFCFHQQV